MCGGYVQSCRYRTERLVRRVRCLGGRLRGADGGEVRRRSLRERLICPQRRTCHRCERYHQRTEMTQVIRTTHRNRCHCSCEESLPWIPTLSNPPSPFHPTSIHIPREPCSVRSAHTRRLCCAWRRARALWSRGGPRMPATLTAQRRVSSTFVLLEVS